MMDQEHSSASRGIPPGALEALYPVPPLSWLAPLWSYACGAIASPPGSGTSAPHLASDGRAGGFLLAMLGLLLAGPLLGVAWAASGQIRQHRALAADAPQSAPQKPFRSMPFTLPGSASAAVTSWLGAATARWQQAGPEAGTALVRLLLSSAFSLALAADLGQRTFIITAAALVCIYARGVLPGTPVEPAGSISRVMTVSLPILVTWLIGHAAFAAMRAGSVLVAACFALALGFSSQMHRTGKGLVPLLLAQALVAVYFVIARQPVTAAGVVLLASSQLLWSPLLGAPVARTEYSRAAQLPLAAAMLLSAWTLGHGL